MFNFGKKKKVQISEWNPDLSTITVTEKAIELEGQKLFYLFKDGNGQYRAQHISGEWLTGNQYLNDSYAWAKTFKTVDECVEMVTEYIRDKTRETVGSVHFVPFTK